MTHKCHINQCPLCLVNMSGIRYTKDIRNCPKGISDAVNRNAPITVYFNITDNPWNQLDLWQILDTIIYYLLKELELLTPGSY